MYLGGENGDRPLKRILDHLIANGDMEPMIVVTPTYYQDNRERGDGVALEDAALTANFYQELQNDLIPAVESRYHTYARSVDAADLQASREHRIFGGFSMGAVTTWYTFLHCMDYFKYYMPISGDCWVVSETHMGTVETAAPTARYLNDYIQDSGYTKEDYVIYALTGTDDTAYSALDRQIEAMKGQPESFAYSDSVSGGNLFFQVAEGLTANDLNDIEPWLQRLGVMGDSGYESAEGTQIKMITDNTETVITLNGSRAAADLAAMLPLELTLIERSSFAKGMTLPERLSSEEATTREYEIGDFGYWDAGPDLAIFYDDIYEQTIVEVIPLGHAETGAEAVANETGTVRLELMAGNGE